MNTHQRFQTNIDLACKLATAGLPVFPCLEADGLALDKDGQPKKAKAPYLGNGFKGASIDLAQVKRWWTAWPGAIVGLPTGSTTGIDVLDGDIDKESGETRGEQQLADLSLDCPRSVKVRTQSGGVQLIYKHVEGARTSSKKVASNVDVRAEGGYVIAPGSIMANGRAYRYEGRTLSEALAEGDLPSFPLAKVQAAIATREAIKRTTSNETPCVKGTEASSEETLEVCRDCLASAPNRLTREDWVKLAASLRAEFGDALRPDFVSFSLRYDSGDCDEAAALHVWNTAVPHTVTNIAPALALLKQAVGADVFQSMWARVLARRDDPFAGFPFGSDGADQQATVRDVPYDWPDPAPHFLRAELPMPPVLPLADVLRPRASAWVDGLAECAGAPPDYVLAALLSSVSSIVGNARWVSPWKGWAEPPLIWTICIGLPSAGKSPAVESVLSGVRRAEKPMRQAAQKEYEDWEARAKLAKLAEQAWESKCRKAMEKGQAVPVLPDEAHAGPAPHIPRLIVNDGTVEKIGVIAAAQPKGVMQFRDELAGWLLSMEARNGGGDRAFWLEAYGGRAFTVERMSRAPLSIDRLSIGAFGGIQPDRLNELLIKTSDDGLLARFMPIWPHPAPVRRPGRFVEDAVADEAWRKLLALEMPRDEQGEQRPWFAIFDDDAADIMDQWRSQCREWESDASGLLLSHIGKMPGLAARLALVLAAIDHAFDDGPQPNDITANHFGRACHFIEAYTLPMARRSYSAASISKDERAAHCLVNLIRKMKWQSFTTRQVMRAERTSLGTAAKLKPALTLLIDADCIRQTAHAASSALGGQPSKAFDVNPAVFQVPS